MFSLAPDGAGVVFTCTGSVSARSGVVVGGGDGGAGVVLVLGGGGGVVVPTTPAGTISV
jgi:hypothetical protein